MQKIIKKKVNLKLNKIEKIQIQRTSRERIIIWGYIVHPDGTLTREEKNRNSDSVKTELS